MNKKTKESKASGFTLIELLIVMTIIAILVSLALVSYQASRKSARDGKRKTDLESIRGALEMFRADNSAYPEGSGEANSALGPLLGDYLSIPSDPITGYQYYYNGTTGAYVLCASLEVGGGSVSGCGSCGSGACNYKASNP